MNCQSSEIAAQQLSYANQLQNNVWRMWKYIVKNRTLILCGYNEPFEVSGFLIFRETNYVHLFQWLHQPIFQLDSKSDWLKNHVEHDKLALHDYHSVSVITDRNKYHIICKEVIYLALPVGVYV
jgi:hypothetical protein